MANWISRITVTTMLLAAQALPAMCQEAAFDADPHSSTSMGPSPITHHSQPISAAAGAENASNLKNWSRFSNSASRPMFVRVPAGTKMPGNSKSHYVRPQCVGAGSQPAQTQPQNGPVRRYLAYNVPAGHFIKKSQQTGTNGSVASAPVRVAHAKPVAVKKAAPTHIQVLGYGKGGSVTSTYVPISGHHRVAVACYHRYQ